MEARDYKLLQREVTLVLDRAIRTDTGSLFLNSKWTYIIVYEKYKGYVASSCHR